jgi:hypothetical protein
MHILLVQLLCTFNFVYTLFVSPLCCGSVTYVHVVLCSAENSLSCPIRVAMTTPE